MLTTEKVELCEKQLIRNDMKSIWQLMDTYKNNGELIACVLPYICLPIFEAYDYFYSEKSNLSSEHINLKDIRNRSKLYFERYNKVVKNAKIINDNSDKYFRNLIKFRFLRKLNIHHNLGLYCTKEGKIIGNTQFSQYLFFGEKYVDYGNLQEEIYSFSVKLGEIAGSICSELEYNPKEDYHSVEKLETYYIDINTFRFKSLKDDLELFLVYLHLLCNINIFKERIEKLIPNNTWVFKTKYLVCYYTLKSLEKILNHKNEHSSDLEFILKESRSLFDTELRNVLVHYRFTNKKGDLVLDKDKLDPTIKFYGIVESRLNIDFEQLSIKLNDLIEIEKKYLEKELKVFLEEIKWDKRRLLD